MSLEKAHRDSLQERPHHPDEPQPVKWGHAEEWTDQRRMFDHHPPFTLPRGRHRKPWGRRTKPWTLATAETDQQARNPEWSMA